MLTSVIICKVAVAFQLQGEDITIKTTYNATFPLCLSIFYDLIKWFEFHFITEPLTVLNFTLRKLLPAGCWFFC